MAKIADLKKFMNLYCQIYDLAAIHVNHHGNLHFMDKNHFNYFLETLPILEGKYVKPKLFPIPYSVPIFHLMVSSLNSLIPDLAMNPNNLLQNFHGWNDKQFRQKIPPKNELQNRIALLKKSNTDHTAVEPTPLNGAPSQINQYNGPNTLYSEQPIQLLTCSELTFKIHKEREKAPLMTRVAHSATEQLLSAEQSRMCLIGKVIMAFDKYEHNSYSRSKISVQFIRNFRAALRSNQSGQHLQDLVDDYVRMKLADNKPHKSKLVAYLLDVDAITAGIIDAPVATCFAGRRLKLK